MGSQPQRKLSYEERLELKEAISEHRKVIADRLRRIESELERQVPITVREPELLGKVIQFERAERMSGAVRMSEELKCDQEGCNFKTNFPNVLGTHKRRVHGIKGERKKSRKSANRVSRTSRSQEPTGNEAALKREIADVVHTLTSLKNQKDEVKAAIDACELQLEGLYRESKEISDRLEEVKQEMAEILVDL